MRRFSEKAKENLRYYVYLLVDPRNNEIFYVGKGKGDRVFDHISATLKDASETEKISLIKEILNEGKEVKHYIIRHGINKETALEIEAVLIDILTYKDFKFSDVSEIKNIVSGYDSERGIKTVDEIEMMYAAEPLNDEDIKHNILLININKTYNGKGSEYEAVRKSWVLNEEKLDKIDFVLAEYKGIIVGIFKPEKWGKEENSRRMYFEGKEVTDENIRQLYLNKKYVGKKKGAQNPIRYIYGR